MSQPAFYISEISTSATYTATDALSGTNVNNIQYATEDTTWGPANITGTKAIVIDNLTALTADTICLLGENMNGVTLEIRGSTDNFVASDVLISTGATLSSTLNTAIRKFTSASYRYWKLNFTTFASNFRVAHVALDTQVALPYLEIDPDEDGLDPIAGHLISKGGLYLGTWQDKTETIMPINFGEITAAEDVILQAWADAAIRVVNPFFFQVDIDVARVHFGRLEGGGSWHAPFQTGVYVAQPVTFITRAI